MLLGALFSVCEYIQSLWWIGFPWGQLSLTQYKFLPFIQSLSLFGSYFVTFLIVVINGYIALFFYTRKRKYLTVALTVFLLNLTFGLVRCAYLPATDGSIVISTVQPSVTTEEKWEVSGEYVSSLELHLKLSESVRDTDLILWPETALPYELFLYENDVEKIEEFCGENGTDILVGTFFTEADNEYNVAVYFGDTEEKMYSKQHLVPFGEYVPLRNFIVKMLPFLDEINMLSNDLSAGEESVVFDTKNGKIGSLICFDSIFSSLARNSVKNGAEILCIITNDSWYKDSVALSQHNAQAVFRAVENNRCVARCANSGISSFINSRGEIMYASEPYEVTTHSEELPLIQQKTLYTVIGDSFAVLAFCFVLLYVVFDKKQLISKKIQLMARHKR